MLTALPEHRHPLCLYGRYVLKVAETTGRNAKFRSANCPTTDMYRRACSALRMHGPRAAPYSKGQLQGKQFRLMLTLVGSVKLNITCSRSGFGRQPSL